MSLIGRMKCFIERNNTIGRTRNLNLTQPSRDLARSENGILSFSVLTFQNGSHFGLLTFYCVLHSEISGNVFDWVTFLAVSLSIYAKYF